MSLSTLEADHKTFLSHLDGSAPAVWLVAQWLQGRGHEVTVMPTGRAEKYGDRLDFQDNGDLRISQRVEVKHLSAEFTGADDWPFAPHFIVCAAHAFDTAVPKPFAFIYLNKSKTHIAMVLSSDSGWWTKGRRKDKRYIDYEQEFYFAPLDMVRWVRL